ncbi:kinase-like domain-containing protein [Cantharellus anzutake]|uniref:kinase-like domain-containing protein n=1 Tax=Cantharellus anzutake TaxID=1750568 RepID=UPI0019070843|nr:kinase-like domain-containing protein [Cantharellus anzutake]KAF8317506.1 kinase-like domain-containing protein [Cantharellus anzutake]
MEPADKSWQQELEERMLQIDPRNLNGVIDTDPQRAREQGCFGTIYKGIYNNRKVCVKVVGGFSRSFEHLIREMRVWCQLTHPHIVQLYGWISYIKEDFRPSLVSNWCDGGNVRGFLERHPNADRRALIYGIAHGVEYLHSEDVVHGDITPANVVMNGNIPQLCDFGTSFLIWDTTTRPGPTVVGYGMVLRYTAPEVTVGESGSTKESDVWGFGCTAMEILRNEQPYSTTTILVDMHNPAALAQSKPPFTPPSTQTEKTLAPCLEFNPKNRIDMGTVIVSLNG